MAEVMLAGYRCERCGHEWLARKKGVKPIACAGCKSPYWDIPPRSEKTGAKKKK